MFEEAFQNIEKLQENQQEFTQTLVPLIENYDITLVSFRT